MATPPGTAAMVTTTLTTELRTSTAQRISIGTFMRNVQLVRKTGHKMLVDSTDPTHLVAYTDTSADLAAAAGHPGPTASAAGGALQAEVLAAADLEASMAVSDDNTVIKFARRVGGDGMSPGVWSYRIQG